MKQIFKGSYTDFKKAHEIIILQSGAMAIVVCECGEDFSATKMEALKAKAFIQELKIWNKVCDWCEKNSWARPDELKIHVEIKGGTTLPARLKEFVGRMMKEAERRKLKEEGAQLKKLLKWVENNE